MHSPLAVVSPQNDTELHWKADILRFQKICYCCILSNLCVRSFLKTRSLVVRGGKFQNHHRINYGTFSITYHLYCKFWTTGYTIHTNHTLKKQIKPNITKMGIFGAIGSRFCIVVHLSKYRHCTIHGKALTRFYMGK